MVPLRWILPISLFCYSAIYLKHRSKLLYFASFCVFACGILWVPDFGLLTFLSLIAFYIYLEFENVSLVKIAIKVVAHLVVGAGAVIAAFSIYSCCIRCAYGAFPDMSLVFSTLKVFAFVGMGMFPIPKTFHPWMLVALTYLVGLCYSIRHVVNRTISARAASVFLLTVVGVFSFQYYWGRSYNWNLTAVMFPFFVLLTIFADDLLGLTKRNRLLLVPFALLIFVLSFSVFQTIYAHRKIIGLISAARGSEENRFDRNRVITNARFIRSHTREKEKVLIISEDSRQALYYDLSKTVAAVNPCFEELFLKSDYQRLLRYILHNDSTKLFMELAASMPKPSCTFCRSVLPGVLSSLYDVSSIEESGREIALLTRKKENTGAAYVLKKEPNDILHEVFDRNFSTKLRYAAGDEGGISLGKTFSVEVVFRPAEIPPSPLTVGSTVFSNCNGRDGMVLLQHGSNRTEYMFSFAGYGVPIPVELKKWNYIAIEIAPCRMHIFKNGTILTTLKMDSTEIAYRNTSTPLYLGSAGMREGFFFGDIRELKIKNGELDKNEMAAGWTSIKMLSDVP
jgi:hypothetical protein